MTDKNLESDVTGNGYGASHRWQNKGTSYARATRYECKCCGAAFWHQYNKTPSIFKAIYDYNVPDECPGRIEKKEPPK